MIKKSVSLIIPAWNEEKSLDSIIKNLKNLKLPFEYSEIILVAGGKDTTYKKLTKTQLENFNKKILLKQRDDDFKRGALIRGYRKSIGDIIIFLDIDVLTSSNFVKEIVKKLESFDVVCGNFTPLLGPGLWKNYYLIFKNWWSRNPSSLNSLVGGASISLKRNIIENIGIKNLFTDKTTAGVDYYMGLKLRKHNKKIGFAENAKILMPRPNNLTDFISDQIRWLTAFYKIHGKDKKLVFNNLILNSVFLIFPFLLLLSNIKKLKVIPRNFSKITSLLTLVFIDFIINIVSILLIIKLLTGNLQNLGHFRGKDRYL
jgi:cellulose synthase/poly-beta-1,6-N-acetylglucosamine synthase-like glycosyltransferase